MAQGKAFGWNDTIKDDGGDFRLLEPGTYPYEITKIEKEYYNGSAKVPACPRAKLTLRVGTAPDVTTITDSILLYDGAEWRIAQFFRSIGGKKHGQEFAMNWDEDYIVGKVGMCEVSKRTYKNKDGEERETNDIRTYLDAPEGDDGDEEW